MRTTITLQLATFHVYILHSESLSKFYVGQTNDINNRLIEHSSGESSFTKSGIQWTLIWMTEKENRHLAEILERKIKTLTVDRKLKFMIKYEEGIVDSQYLKKLISREDTAD